VNRRDLLKAIGISGVGAVANAVTGREVEAAPVVTDNVIRDSAGNVVYNLPNYYAESGSVTITHADGTREYPVAISGTGPIWCFYPRVDGACSYDVDGTYSFGIEDDEA
jgi:hypothetical protein